MKRRQQRAVTPVWAKAIEVTKRADVLLVTGRGHLSTHIDPRNQDPAEIAGLDLYSRVARYRKRQLTSKKGTTEAGIYQFADANDDNKLVEFVSEFGPVWGDVQPSTERDSAIKLIVEQDLSRLRNEQRIFAAVVELLSQINRNAKADLRKVVRAMASIAPPMQLPRSLPRDFPKIEVRDWNEHEFDDYDTLDYMSVASYATIAIFLLTERETPEHEKRYSVLNYAHLALCEVLNAHPPELVPFGNEAIELPRISDKGIRAALYFKLRLEYLAQRSIGTCLKCGGHFPVLKRGARACSEACRRALRNQKYWNKHKKDLNRNRRQQRATRR